ncbi:MAG TPA: LPS export ABC transporter ATP-binding protein [Beijerinckiaceae bacterium]|jgi:lipopolysaccharide export system ATP-binding protein|nr:LPS export ABC transporter ATP-binding protein [Beijerinckiaceae bacterium]
MTLHRTLTATLSANRLIEAVRRLIADGLSRLPRNGGSKWMQPTHASARSADFDPAYPAPDAAPYEEDPDNEGGFGYEAVDDGKYFPGEADTIEQSRQNDAPAVETVSGEGVLAIYQLGKSYRSRQVVADVSLYVQRGEAVGLLGPNGAGKTTVFYMITGLVLPDKGVIELDGRDVTTLPMYRRARLGIGYLPQEASIFRGLSVEDNIKAVLEMTEPDRDRRAQDLENLLDEFDIKRLRKTPSIALSGGERRRCEIARALAGRPTFMLLDEPFAGIDPIAVGDIQDLVRHLTSRGIGVLITDHNVRETLGLIDRAYIIHSGHVLTEGSPEEIVANPDVRRFYLGRDFRM